MNAVSYCRLCLLLPLLGVLGACSPGEQVACNEEARGRAGQFMLQVLEQEANGLRLRELASKGSRPVFYANVGYDAAEESRSDMIYVRNGFKVVDVSCAAELRDDNGKVAAQQLQVRVQFPPGLWFDRQTYGEQPAGEYVYTLRLDEKFKITGRLSQPFVSGRTAIALLGAQPYTAEPLLELREQLVGGPRQQ